MNFLYLTILFPLIGFLLLSFSGSRWADNVTAIVGLSFVGLSAITTVYIGLDFLRQGYPVFHQVLWTWMQVQQFKIDIQLTLDGLSLTLLSIVTCIGFFIHLFASWYMRGVEGYARFFAYTNLFMASMTVLVLADNLLLMYLGWECVGLCSYLLIGFYYSNSTYGAAAIKSFIMTRIGDICFIIALCILYYELGTLSLHEMVSLLPIHYAAFDHHDMLSLATIMLAGAAIGKSAQIPLQTWLSDAMVGPTPVSALIHSATMVTAGVYLIARTHSFFLITPGILNFIGGIGAFTLLLAGLSALVQNNIKRILAYSTMSQLGYMFLALGVQAWEAAIFHLMTHAFFKALLFLAAGSVILGCQNEQNILKMGGLRHRMPLVYMCFLVGGSSLSAIPILTSGFFSKEEILAGALAQGSFKLVIVGLIGELITALYTFRMIFMVFHGKEKLIYIKKRQGIAHHFPLIILLILSTFIGSWITLPLASVFPGTSVLSTSDKYILELISALVVISGFLISALLWLGQPNLVNIIAHSRLGRLFSMWWFFAWGFDWLYKRVFVNSYFWVSRLVSGDPLNTLISIPASLLIAGQKSWILSASGFLSWYLISIISGALLLIIFLII
ncbi:NADH-quinone oxidoreductase subunit L [Candidatus Erwinia haradaeae]|uniref:NADH-quinone oxidoreductase subunit L n=1 Tax=Candidatus Erwinia haradaeae TaxID=1922217 RepID=A0A803FSX2_9GAMM|nr:NADH-quinone oxidoreductase subunit L [Candidatus Erwinia haradaeae]VFP87248.1 NADH-quinone oxidoreductase subunit L [Candidatus Erwinia haradaeae]